MQVPLEAIRHHLEDGALRHIWVLATSDIKDETGKIIRPGSHGLVAACERILRAGLGWRGVTVHHCGDEPELIVPPYNVRQAFAVVDRVYRQEAPRAGLADMDVIADITGGTVTMTAGMLLACALLRRPLQYTAADNDPLKLDSKKPWLLEGTRASF
jgi:hypothetical protein